MNDKPIVIDLTGKIELEIDNRTSRSDFVHRATVADTATGLLLALNAAPEAAGVVILARALGCKIK